MTKTMHIHRFMRVWLCMYGDKHNTDTKQTQHNVVTTTSKILKTTKQNGGDVGEYKYISIVFNKYDIRLCEMYATQLIISP